MKINHTALYVQDLEGAREFFCKYFAAMANKKYHNPRTDFQSYFLSFDGDARLEIMTRPDLPESPKGIVFTGYVHLAFSVGSKQNVDGLTLRLREDGFIVISGPRTTGDGYYESCILDAEGNQIEIVE